MLKKYKLVDAFEGGVDHLIDGRRVPVSQDMTDEQAEVLINAGLPYFETIKQPIEANGQTNENHENDENSGSDIVDSPGGNSDQPAPTKPARKPKASRNAN